MGASSKRWARRPAIEPIQTSCSDLPDRSVVPPQQRRPGPMSQAVRSGAPASPSWTESGSPTQGEEGEMRLDKPAPRTLRISDSASTAGLTTPSGTRSAIAGLSHPTPVSAVSTGFRLAPPIIEIETTQSRDGAAAGNGPLTPMATDSPRLPLSVRLSMDRRQSAPCCGAAIRQLHFQKFREDLWKRGTRTFGDAESADAFVMPLQLQRPLREAASSSPDNGGMLSPLLSPKGRLTVRAVVRSKRRPAIGLRREFELDKLRATTPDPLPSPRSPNFDREALLSALGTPSDASPPSPMEIDRGHKPSAEGEKADSGNRSPSLGRHHPGAVAVPMHIQYARAHLPALAAIMMSDQVFRGDTIDLAVPHPRAWSETAAYVYTGEEELLTEQVKENIMYLGGKIRQEN